MSDNMTYNVYSDAGALLVPSQIYNPAAVAADLSLVPSKPGIYSWWSSTSLPELSLDGCHVHDGRRLLYVGICPNGTNSSSKRTLRNRMKEHCRGPIRRSTLRRALASLLKGELGLQVAKGSDGKPLLLGDGEEQLSQWMGDHLRVAWMDHSTPWVLEAEVIRTIALPLNVMGNSNPNSVLLRQRRAEL
ncbi:MAG: hypothetical protein IPK28_10350 [Devosia sp.]|nr:hypothetical protein [Devosia sp.]